MENEGALWLRRFPVPIMISSFDANEDLVLLDDDPECSHLMGFFDERTSTPVLKWRLLKPAEIPFDQLEEGFLENVYSEIPFRRKAEVGDAVRQDTRRTLIAAWSILFFIFVVPVLIEIVGLGVWWLGYILSAISISVGVWKAANALGWRKASAKEEKRAAKEARMKHYFWHCERNPKAFERLKFENFEREAKERTLSEYKTRELLSALFCRFRVTANAAVAPATSLHYRRVLAKGEETFSPARLHRRRSFQRTV